MSSATPAGAISIQAALDLSQPYAALAQFRAEAAKSVGIAGQSNFVGPTGVPIGATGAASTAPATFANPSGRAAFIGPAGLALNPGGVAAAFGGGGAGNLGQAGQQLTQAAQALTQAAQALAGAGSRQQTGPGGGGGAGGGGGSNRILGLRAGGLMRYVGAGFLAREVLNVADTVRDYGTGEIRAQGRPRESMANELSLYDRTSKIPIFGQAASLLIDPAGTQRLGAELTAEIADESFGLQYRALGNQMGAMTASDRAKAERLIGFRAQRASVETTYKEKVRAAGAAKMNPEDQQKYDAYAAARRAQVNADFYSDELAEEVDDANNELIPGRRKAMEGAEADILQQRRKLDKNFDASMKTADLEKTNALERINRDEKLQYRRLYNEAALIGNPDPNTNYPGPSSWIKNRRMHRVDEEEAIRLEVNNLEEQYGDNSLVPKAYRKLQDERLRRDDFEFDQQARKSLRSMTTSTNALNIASGNDRLSQGEYPGTRRALSQLQGIIDSTESHRLALLDEYGTGAAEKGLLHANAMAGRAQLVALRQQFQDSIHGVSVNPFTQSLSGVGGANEQKIRQQIDRAFNKVGSESTRFPGDTMGNGGGGTSSKVEANTDKAAISLANIEYAVKEFISRFVA